MNVNMYTGDTVASMCCINKKPHAIHETIQVMLSKNILHSSCVLLFNVDRNNWKVILL